MATIVSAFYPLRHSKHGVAKYTEWIRNFCQIPQPMVIFTDSESSHLFSSRAPELTHILVKDFNTFQMTTPERMAFWQQQHSIDAEAGHHNPELYAVWAMKQECVSMAIELNPFGHDWFIWCDIGIQREPHLCNYYATFPDTTTLSTYCKPGYIHFLEVQRIPNRFVESWGEIPMVYPPPSVSLGGGCILGDKSAWVAFSVGYMEMLDKFGERGWFAGKDQIIYFAMLMEKVMRFRLFHATGFGRGGDPWMSFPVILGGQAPANIDSRFEETHNSV